MKDLKNKLVGHLTAGRDGVTEAIRGLGKKLSLRTRGLPELIALVGDKELCQRTVEVLFDECSAVHLPNRKRFLFEETYGLKFGEHCAWGEEGELFEDYISFHYDIDPGFWVRAYVRQTNPPVVMTGLEHKEMQTLREMDGKVLQISRHSSDEEMDGVDYQLVFTEHREQMSERVEQMFVALHEG